MSRINDASLNQIGGVIQLYKYEPFSQFIKVNPTYANTSLSFTTSSPLLFSFLSNVDASTVTFFSTAGPNTSSSNLSLVIQAISNSSIVQTKSYTVNIGAGRFLNPPSNTTYDLYKNEPLGTSRLFVGSIPINKPVSTVSLPGGIGFVSNDICSYYLTGTPLITYPLSNYNIIASDASSRTINTLVNIRVNPERVILDNSGTSNVTGAAIGSSIPPLSIIGRCPPYPYSGSNIAYTWTPSLPDGLRFTNSAGTTLSNGAIPITDSSSTITLQGAITTAGIKTLSSSNLNITVTGTRVSQPVISNTANLSLTFEESVVFDVPTISNVYKDASFTYTSNYNTFRAYTLFADASITSMTASSLPTGVYLDFSSNAQRGYLVGTPSATQTCNATITATNANAKTRNLPVTISVAEDVITFSTFPSTSTFIVGRSLSNAKTGYYSSPLTFRATSGSGCNVTMSMSGLSGTGLTFSGTSGSTATYTLSGRPTTDLSLTSFTVTANIAATSKTSTSNYSFSIVPDAFTFSPDPSLVLIQNIPMTPVDIVATTLSELPVIQYISANIPAGISIGANGRISGTPLSSDTSGTFTVLATTGPTSALSPTYTYTLTPDSILLFAPQNLYTVNGGDNVSIDITGLSYSGGTVSNYQFSGLPQTGLTIHSNTGLITGPLSDSVPPNPVLPFGTTSFDVCGAVSRRFGALPGTFTTVNPVVNRSFLGMNRPAGADSFSMILNTTDTGDVSSGWVSSNTTLDSGQVSIPSVKMSDFKVKNTSVDSNLFLATLTDVSGRLLRSSNGVDFSNVFLGGDVINPIVVSSLANKTGTSTWFTSGIDASFGSVTTRTLLKQSTDDGLTWSTISQIKTNTDVYVYPRNKSVPSASSNLPEYPYIFGGTSLAYKNGTLIAGGNGNLDRSESSFLQSSNDGVSWTGPAGSTLIAETSKVYLDGSGAWIVTGSDLYNTENLTSWSSDANTILYSTDDADRWSNAEAPVQYNSGSTSGTNGSFNYIAYDVAYGNGCWVASGISAYNDGGGTYFPEIRVSSNGSNWRKIPYFDSILQTSGTATYGLIGPIVYANNAWNVVTIEPSGTFSYTRVSTNSSAQYGDTGTLSTGWTTQYLFDATPVPSVYPTFRGFTAPQYVRTGVPTQAIIQFQGVTVGGPTFTSPAQRNYTLYQYMPITPITFSATGTGRVYFFLQTEDLPPGLVWNTYTATISGKSAELGSASFTVYAKDDVGVSSIVIQTETIIPRVIRQQSGAGAYTYLLKQYTEVLGAQASRDKKALPDEDSTLGKFMAPPAPDVMSASNTCGCPTK